MRCKDALKAYKSYLLMEKGLSQNTVKGYLSDLTELIDHVQKTNIEDLTKDDINDYLSDVNDQYSASTMERKIVAFRQFYVFLCKERITDENIMEGFELPKLPKKLPEVVSLKEAAQVLDSIDTSNPIGMRDYCMINLILNSGLRVSEMVNLTISSLHLKERLLDVYGKGDKERIIPLDQKTCDILKDYIYHDRMELNKEGSSLLFLTRKGKPVSRENFYRILKKHAQKAGVKAHFTPHKLRHTFATTMLEEDADLRTIQELLGHSDLSTTTIYTHVNNAKMIKDYQRFHPGSRNRKD